MAERIERKQIAVAGDDEIGMAVDGQLEEFVVGRIAASSTWASEAFEHRPSQTSPALLRRNAAWIAVGRRLGLQIEHGFSTDGCDVCEARISPSCF